MRSLVAGLLFLVLSTEALTQEPKTGDADRLPTATRPEPSTAEEQTEREEPIETDRDAFTPQTRTVGKGLSILEAAYSFIDNRHDFEKHSFPELLYRYGIFERVELRLGWNYEVGGGGSSISG